MPNFIVSYDRDGPTPTHAQMDEHLRSSGWAWARILGNVWYVGAVAEAEEVMAFAEQLLGENEGLLVVRCEAAAWRKLLVQDKSLKRYWESY